MSDTLNSAAVTDTTATAAGTAGVDAGAAPPTEGQGEKDIGRAAEKAVQRAEARASKKNTGDAGEQAAGGDKPTGASTPEVAAPEATTKEGAKSAEEGDKPTLDSTAAAPENWPKDRREAYAALPDDTSRALVMAFYKDIQAGFTKATQQVAEIVKQNDELFGALKEHGADVPRVKQLLNIGKMFEADPRNVITELAKEKGIEVFFERPLPEGEMPEFKDTAEMAEWMRNQAKSEAERTLKAASDAEEKRQAEREQETARNSAKEALQKELDEAGKEHADFGEHKAAVFDTLARAPGLSVKEAYHLVRLPALLKLAEEGTQAKAELTKLKAQQERAAKDTTRPPSSRRAELAPEDKNLSPAERAHKRAQARMAQQQNA
ncbi:MAG: hypothetical protein CVV05_15480 [Gammaproteobacteria bacterium HGW-Gammaproteobacteria-1]|jgi:hypothetical protein|nr:MAG: hypothetical protein CVV05_15480 [Gammaproteobacteria bacterium HGW-Gammaproteobacteria-1]